jgi:hypothetical protein
MPRSALRYLESLPERPVAPRPGAMAAQAALDDPLPGTPGDPAATLELLDRVGTPATWRWPVRVSSAS